MNILVTGANGFIGKNLCATLHNIQQEKDKSFEISPALHLFAFDVADDPALLDEYCAKADFVFNLAGVNRPKDQAEFMQGNFGFASTLLGTLKKHKNTCPVMLSSSTQAALDNPYGQSKKAGEELFFQYEMDTGAQVLVYRFPNVFGKWCRPNYNSAVATFCYQIAHDLPITINDPSVVMKLVYIDDVVSELIHALAGRANRQPDGYCAVSTVHTAALGEIANLIQSFRACREERSVPDMSDAFTKKLYATYLSYLPEEQFSYPLTMHEDARGSFTEMLRTPERGQISVNISKPGITKGNHWHHTKNEKFLVVSGTGVIRLRKVGGEQVHTYYVSGERLEVVEIPTGYTHNIENLGDSDMTTLMWASDCFDPEKPDTYFLEVSV